MTDYAHALPAHGCDCHVHVFGPYERFPLAPDRAYTPGTASIGELTSLLSRLGLSRVVIVQASPQGTDNACLIDALDGPIRRVHLVLAGDIHLPEVVAPDVDGLCRGRLVAGFIEGGHADPTVQVNDRQIGRAHV